MGRICSASSIISVLVICLSISMPGNCRPIASTTNITTKGWVDNGHGRTPPMGWSSWNSFHCNITEELIIQIANAMVFTGLADLGYKYINLDDCWGRFTRSPVQHKLEEDREKFPSGLAALGNYIHSLGLQFGIYSSAGTSTCSGSMPGSLGHEQADAYTFASWGVDYLKYDNCYNNGISPLIRYRAMSDALRATGRPIFYNICEWGDMEPALWAGELGNSWRTADDIVDNWNRMLCIADKNAMYAEYARPGAWNDPDTLEVGNGGMSHEEYKVHFSIWAISKAPLILGCDIRNLSSETWSLISNSEVIAVNQDPLGIQAKKVRNYGQRDLWAGPLSQNRFVILFVNRKTYDLEITAHWSDVGIPDDTVVLARDLWLHQDLSDILIGNFSVTVKSHSCKMFILTPHY
ncbi:hypothetical protein Droror1_Dr00017442 [Drosera rotundifolia]